jgi:branched-chain amino acid transport system ATP-binding protein
VDVSVEFAGLRALDRVSLRLEPGEILGLIGPNGSGKTTLVNALTGQLRPIEGRILCDGSDITGLPPPRIAGRGIARSFQIVRLFRNLTVRENVEAGAIARGLGRPAARAVAGRLLAEFGLGERADAFAGSLSYGDERRVEIARALAAAPTFLLLDEPAAGMNSEEVGHLADRIRSLKGQGRTVVLVEHVMELVMGVTERIAVLNFGRKIAEGSPAEVQANQAVREAYLGTGAKI